MARTIRGKTIKPFSLPHEVRRIDRFISKCVRRANARGVVLGLSGGIDSAVVAYLSARAIGPENVLAVLLFEEDMRHSGDYKDARNIANDLGIETIELDFSEPVSALKRSLAKVSPKLSRVTIANVKARTRMVLLYGVANQRNLLVIGTGDKSEAELGYFTKYGDGGVDLLPIGHLLKSEVRELADYLRIPSRIVNKPSSPRLWKGHKASDELPADYPILDRILSKLLDSSSTPEEVSFPAKIPRSIVQDVISRREKSLHKRKAPPVLSRRRVSER